MSESALAPFETFARRWRQRQQWVAVLRTAVVVPPMMALGAAFVSRGIRSAAVAIAILGVFLLLWLWQRSRRPPVGLVDVARYLDCELHELEHSGELLLSAPDDLPLVARLQRERLTTILDRGLSGSGLPSAGLRGAMAAVVAALLLGLVIAKIGSAPAPADTRVTDRPTAVIAEPELAAESVEVEVSPPAYTDRVARRSRGLDVEAEEGSRLRWEVRLAGQPVAATLLFEEGPELTLEATSDGHFEGRLTAAESRLYRLVATSANGDRLETNYARLDVIPDLAPVITVVEPVPFLELSSDQLNKLELEIRAEVRDDHGFGTAAIVATVASGYGELVEFRERRLPFQGRGTLIDSSEGALLTSRLDLAELGVRPGVELFFFVEAFDRRRPQPNRSRSASHIIRVAGGGTRSVGLSSRLPVLRVPEFFRSQRQIILDTEKLLSEEASLTADEFSRRSESIGFDQRSLRMRYGGLLGEEFESGRPASSADEEFEEHEQELRRLDEMEPVARTDRAELTEVLESLPEGLAHQHDSAEIATYFDSEIKAQLKEALQEMWGAEGELRVIAPRKALPYEYRALRLLKVVQQRSRLYVQKIGFEPPELFPDDQRLTGDLSKIRTVRRRADAPPRQAQELRQVGAALAGVREQRAGNAFDSTALAADAEVAVRLLARRARADVSVDLEGLQRLRSWITALEGGTELAPADLLGVEEVLWNLLPEPGLSPGRGLGAASELVESYRRRLGAGRGP